MVADGSLDVCSLIALPLTIIPGVGDIVGTIGDWVCIVPAVIAIDHVSAFHGSRETHYWEPALALVLKKGWETLVDTPIIVVTVAAGIGSAASGIALFAYADTPGTVVAAGVVAVTLGVYLGLRAGRDGIGDLIFDKVYNGLVPEVGDIATADARTDSWIQPGVSGFPANFGLIATVAGSKPQFHWSHLIPVAGPVLRADAHAEGVKRRTRRYGREVMAVDKMNLAAMDDTINILTGIQGWSNAAAHAAIITGVGFFAAGAVSSFNNPNDKTTAEILGGIGLGASAVAGVAITVGTAADKLQPIVVPLVWAAADDPLPGTPSAVPEPVPGPESVDVE